MKTKKSTGKDPGQLVESLLMWLWFPEVERWGGAAINPPKVAYKSQKKEDASDE